MKKLFFILMLFLCLAGCSKKVLPPIVSYADGGSLSYADTNAKYYQIPKNAFKFESVYFGFNDAKILDSEIGVLKNNAQYLVDNIGVTVCLEGYCDERGTEQYNLSLGQKRAESVKAFLVAYGVNANRIVIISYGEERQVCSESFESCWSKNRFVKFVVN